jgi:hypothetical protein
MSEELLNVLKKMQQSLDRLCILLEKDLEFRENG